MITLPKINPKHETEKIVNFLKSVQKNTKINKVVIGLSGGIDSTTVHYLLKKVYKPENIIGVSLDKEKIESLSNSLLKKSESIKFFSTWEVRSEASTPTETKNFDTELLDNKIRLGNIMARVRMIILFDLAKKYNALVCGTENKSEQLLGYFTRYGDAASDIEPISHLYKNHVYQLAEYLNVPKKIINAKPTAGLWKNQTDEGEFGFTYKEADIVLYLYYEKKMRAEKIRDLGLPNAKKIITRSLKNQFKHTVPYRV
ncbi:NAD(+) synthase [Candidatus Roizmanbacteria bacterium]|nr:NAD(+) synthase [Candidatus Roizmanbacteria bacterium]